MLERKRLVELIRQRFVDAEVILKDLTGTQDHYDLQVVSSDFEQMSPLARHRAVYATLRGHFDGDIHALALQTLTPTEAGASSPNPLTGSTKDNL